MRNVYRASRLELKRRLIIYEQLYFILWILMLLSLNNKKKQNRGRA